MYTTIPIYRPTLRDEIKKLWKDFDYETKKKAKMSLMGLEDCFPPKILYPQLSKMSILTPGRPSPPGSPSGAWYYTDSTTSEPADAGQNSTGGTYLDAYRWALNVSGTISKIAVKIQSIETATDIWISLYDSSDNRVSQTIYTLGTVSTGWNEITLNNTYSHTSGNFITIAWQMNVAGWTYKSATGTNYSRYYLNTFGNGPPSDQTGWQTDGTGLYKVRVWIT